MITLALGFQDGKFGLGLFQDDNLGSGVPRWQAWPWDYSIAWLWGSKMDNLTLGLQDNFALGVS